MKAKNTNKNNKKNKNLLNKKTKRGNKELISEKEEEILVPNTITKDLSVNMKSANKKYKLVKCLINDLHFVEFEFFYTVNNIPYIIYIKKDKDYYNSLNEFEEKYIILFYDIINEQIIFQIKNPHSDNIEDIKYIFDKKNKRDLIVSISLSTIKIWNFKNMQVLYEINKEYKGNKYINIINIINNDDYIHINEALSGSDIITYNIDGQKINTIKTNKIIYNIESFIDNKAKKSYIIVNYNDYLVSYDHDNNNKKYRNYYHDTYNEKFKIIINNEEENIKLIGLGLDYPFVIIWDFHSGNKLCDVYLKQKIEIAIYLGIDNSFLWDNNHLCLAFTLSGEFKLPVCNLKLFDLKKYEICDEIIDFKERNIDKIKRFQHPLYGDCLITQCNDENIKLWKLKNGN